jgi:hypothetical protein
MPRFTVKVFVDAPRGLTREEAFREVIQEQLSEVMPEAVYYTTEDGEEHELSVEMVE